MIALLRKHHLVWPTVLSALGIAVLVSLGVWQLQRKEWKDALVEKISASTASEQISLSNADDVDKWFGDGNVEYSNVKLRGVFDHSKERYLYVPHKTYGPGFDVYSPLVMEGGRVAWVNRGYVPQRLKLAATRQDTQSDGLIDVVGRVRFTGRKSTFTPQNDLDKNQWYWRDLAGMHASAFDPQEVKALPFFVVASRGARADNGWPRPGASKVEVFNRHLEYALTWFGLALTLVGVFTAFVWQRISNTKNPSGG